MYSSVWNWVISNLEAGFARCKVRQIAEPEWASTNINLHLLVEAIVHDQAMGHPDPMGLHRMTRDIGVVTNIGVVEIGDFLVAIVWPIQINGIKRSQCRHIEIGCESRGVSLN